MVFAKARASSCSLVSCLPLSTAVISCVPCSYSRHKKCTQCRPTAQSSDRWDCGGNGDKCASWRKRLFNRRFDNASFISIGISSTIWIVIARYRLQHWGTDAIDARTVSHFSKHTALPLPYLARGSPIHRGFVDPDLSIGGADCKSCDTLNRSSVWSATVSSKFSTVSTKLRTSASAPPLGSSCITASSLSTSFHL